MEEIIWKYNKTFLTEMKPKTLKAVRIGSFFILKVANILCFILIAVEIFHNIIRK